MGLSQSQSQSLYGTDSYAGWGETEAAADAKTKGISAGNYSSSSSSGGNNLNSYVQQQQELQKQAIQPAIQSYYQCQPELLEIKYTSILNAMLIPLCWMEIYCLGRRQFDVYMLVAVDG